MSDKMNTNNLRQENPESFKQKSKRVMNEKVIPFMGKLGNQRHMGAIRDAFGTMIPLIIAGSISVLINAIIFGGAGSGYVSLLGMIAWAFNPDLDKEGVTALLADATTGWGQTSTIMGLAIGHINTITVGMMSIYTAFLLGYFIAISRNHSNPIVAGLTSMAGFGLSTMGEIAFFMDAKGLIAAIIFGLLCSEIFIKLTSVRALNIKLPDGVPPAVGKSFAVFLPVAITLLCVAGINIIVFAPAVVTGNLYVQGGSSWTISLSGDDGLKELNSLILGIEKEAWVGNELVSSFLEIEFTSFDQFTGYVDSLSVSEQSVIGSVLMTSSNGGSLALGNAKGQLVGFDQFTKLTAIFKDEQFILSINYQAVNLGSSSFGMAAAIFQFISSWFLGLVTGDSGIWVAILFVMVVSFFWFFGIHGTNVIAGVFDPIFLMVFGINSALVTSLNSYDAAYATGEMGIFARAFFDGFAFIGGAGATLPLLLMTLMFSKRQELKELAKYSTPPGVFNISEPVIFGYPLILNPVYLFPFMFAPVVNVVIAYIFMNIGAVKVPYLTAPWTAPFFLSSVLITLDIKALIPIFIIFAVDILLYLPFILLDNLLYFKKIRVTDPELYKAEMLYYVDPNHKFAVDTQHKYDALINKGDTIVDNVEVNTVFWAKRMKPEELEKRVEEEKTKALAKQKHYVEKAEALRTKRDSIAVEKHDAWAIKAKKRKAKNKMFANDFGDKAKNL
ncbi:PTS system, cellobiose-specific IIC component [Spiroplasma sp. TIUS-1]|uniref:PTS sugar transporter subunit IIC n=1 Tax=Spiroplasma sp. TIUS-1 TaxID=216963 RepID=UPI001397BFF9|nr:PTS transporter subunit EIIC [Spiroplasma sp. TIUS-1]QHX35725.1 PTS system, cellobiose-specific IIC component [Spiroplasma sp. TIUS-1]